MATALQVETPQQVIERAVLFLAARCDGASSEDGAGFNKYDSAFGHDLASRIQSGEIIQHLPALRVVSKYRKQLERGGIALPALEIVQGAHEQQRAERAAKIAAERTQGVVVTAFNDSMLHVTFPYDPARVELVRALPGRRWEPSLKVWSVPTKSLDAVLKAFPDAQLTGDLGAKLDAARAESERVQAERFAAIRRDLDRYEREVRPELVRRLAEIDRTLLDHQDTGIQWLVTERSAILADDMGLGKTLQALATAKVFAHPILVVAPAGLRINWFREAAMVGVQIAVHSWSKVPTVPEGVKYTLIADEAHYAQNMKAARTKKFLELAKHAAAVITITGTPLKNGRPANLFPLLAAIDHDLAKDRKGYEVRYCNAGPTSFSRWDVTGAVHLDELHRKIADKVLRRMKEDCLDLPEKVRVVERADLSDAAQQMYDDTLHQLQAEYQRKKAAGEIGEADALVLMNHLRHAGSLAKTETAIAKADEVIEQGGQVVIFTAFKDSAEQIADALNAARITGDVSTEQRQAAIDAFQAGQKRAIVCTLGAGNVGITLTAAQTVILVDRPWTPGDAIQAEDRCHRIGQRGSVLAVWLQAGEADEAIDTLLLQKHERIEMVLSGKRKTLRGLGSMRDVAEALLAA